MHKFRLFIDLDKEEAWLREMSAQGWLFRRKSISGYWFTQENYGEQIYRIDYRKFKTLSDYNDYLSLFEDSGWIKVEGSKGSGYQYFAAQTNNAKTDIFSSDAERASRYRKIAQYWIVFLVFYVAVFAGQLVSGTYPFELWTNPMSPYIDAGILDMPWHLTPVLIIVMIPYVLSLLYALAIPIFAAISMFYVMKARSLRIKKSNA